MEKKKGLGDGSFDLLRGRPRKIVYAGVHLAVIDKKHVVVLVGPPDLLEMLEDESDRLANMGWWQAKGLPAEPGVWACTLECVPVSYDTDYGREHDEDWRVVEAERVWAPPESPDGVLDKE